MNVFLTGSTGLLGINTAHSLLAHGHQVFALARNIEKARRVLPVTPHLTVIPGDIEEPDKWLPQLANADALIHSAAYFREYFGVGDHATKLRTLNVDLPVLLTKTAEKYGLSKTILVSSSGAIAARKDGTPADESDAPESNIPENAYFVSKVEMERQISVLLPSLRHTVVLVRLGWMFGPNDYAPTGAGQLVLQLLKTGVVQLVNGTPLHTCDARDVAEGIVLSLEKTTNHAIFNLAGEARPAINSLRELARQAGKGQVQQIPLPVALGMSSVLAVVSRLTRKPNPIPRVGLLTVSRGIPISSEKALRELQLRFRPFSETARDTIAFFQCEYKNYLPL